MSCSVRTRRYGDAFPFRSVLMKVGREATEAFNIFFLRKKKDM